MKNFLFACTVAISLVFFGCGSGSESRPAGGAGSNGGPPRADLMKVPEELNKPVSATVSQGSIDVVHETGAIKISDQERVFRIKSSDPLWFRGWAYDDSSKKIPNRVWIELAGKSSRLRFFIPADRAERPDVAAGFKVPWARMAGFGTPEVYGHNIPPGAYDVKLYQIDGDAVKLTKYYATGAVTLLVE